MSDSEECVLKGGHAPAVKAGGMRITQHKLPKEEKPVPKPSDDDEEEQPPPVKQSTPKTALLISGAPARGNKDFPPEAVQAFHEKPTPTKEISSASSRPMVIQQPRK